MRLYLISTRYSMSIQAGIQAMHAIPELYEKYLNPKQDKECLDVLRLWATRHKTIMHLRTMGGNDSVESLRDELAPLARDLKLPWAMFREPELKHTATSIGIVVPTGYYSAPVEFQIEPMQQLHAVLDKYPFAI